MQQADDEDDEDELFAEMTTTNKGQTKLSFGKKTATTSKTKAKAPVKAKAAPKGKGKQVVADSDDDDDNESPRSSHTLRDDFDELDDDEPAPSQRKTASTKRAAARKPVPTVMLDDSDSESDSGLTFKVRLPSRPTGVAPPSIVSPPFPRFVRPDRGRCRRANRLERSMPSPLRALADPLDRDLCCRDSARRRRPGGPGAE